MPTEKDGDPFRDQGSQTEALHNDRYAVEKVLRARNERTIAAVGGAEKFAADISNPNVSAELRRQHLYDVIGMVYSGAQEDLIAMLEGNPEGDPELEFLINFKLSSGQAESLTDDSADGEQ